MRVRHKSNAATPLCYHWDFLFHYFALFLLHLISLKIFSPTDLLPKDLFIETESLNPTLRSSEAVRWQLLMSILIRLTQPRKKKKKNASALPVHNVRGGDSPEFSFFGGARWGEGFSGRAVQKLRFFFPPLEK